MIDFQCLPEDFAGQALWYILKGSACRAVPAVKIMSALPERVPKKLE